ncbi:MAG: outer membrane protein assembly factor BamE [Alphaproteobacteria bacterium]
MKLSCLKKVVKTVALVGFLLSAAACVPMMDNRGSFPDDNKITNIVPGKTSSFEVERYLGSPSSRSIFGDTVWYYISSKQKRFAFYKLEELERKVLAITFDNDNVVSKMDFYDKNDSVNVDIAGKETQTYGHSIGFMEQLLGNLGRFEQSKD